MPGVARGGRDPGGRGRAAGLAFATALLCGVAPPSSAQAVAEVGATPAPAAVEMAGGEAARRREDKLKAALLLRIAERVTWPPEAFPESDTVLSICAVGSGESGLALDELDDREVAGRRTAVRHFPSPRELEYCHVLVIAGSERPRLGQILEVAGRAPVLTAGTADDFAESGGIVELRSKALRVGFELNAAAAETAGLELDRTLLELADQVHR